MDDAPDLDQQHWNFLNSEDNGLSHEGKVEGFQD